MQKNTVHPKVIASTLAGAIVTILNVILYHATGYNPSPAEVGAEVTIASALTGYLTT